MPATQPLVHSEQIVGRKLKIGIAISIALLLIFAISYWCGQSHEVNDNAVSEWNYALEQAEMGGTVPIDGRSAAILQVAVYDAVNGIFRRYQPYRIKELAPVGANAESAADVAAYTIIVAIYPEQKTSLDQRLSDDLKKVRAPTASVASGCAWGKHVAQIILKWRHDDGNNRVVSPYIGSLKVGMWRPVDGQPFGDHPGHANIETFGVKDAKQFLPGPPPALNSSLYTTDVAQVRVLGGADSTVRTFDQTENAQFLSDSVYLRWNRVARQFVNSNVDLEDSARIFALLDISCADAGITTWKAKYTYGYWRPQTAIINARNSPDVNWRSLIPTPNHPEYVCNHCSVSGAASVVLTNFFGNVPFTDISTAQPGVTRRYASFDDLAENVKLARLYGGVHYWNSITVGDRLGKQIGRYVLAHDLRHRSDGKWGS